MLLITFTYKITVMKTFVKILPLLLLIIGCSSGRDNTTPANLTASTQKGIIAGSITFEAEKPMNDIYRFFYEATSGDKKFKKRNSGKIMIKARDGKEKAFTGDFNNSKTYLFVLELEPGDYAFTQYNYLDRIGPTGMVSFSDKFSLPCTVKAETINYIGEFTYNDNAVPGTPRIIIADSMSRDINELTKKFPGVNWNTTANTTIKSGDTGKGIVHFIQ